MAAAILSPAVQDYLKAVLALSLMGRPVTSGSVARRLHVATPSATNMLKRLARARLVHYAPRGHVRLTSAGRRAALSVLRRHRVIELYLMRALELSAPEAHQEAEQMEHALSPLVEARLDDALARAGGGALLPSRGTR